MEKLIHERLRESLGKLDDCCNISSEIINHLRSDLGLTEDQKSYANDLRNIINYIADQVEKYYIPHPRFEDGEPVQFGDDVDWENCGDYHPQSPWRITAIREDGIPIATAVDKVVAVAKISDDGFIKRPEHKVLDADGVETKAGDTVYTKSGIKYTVEKIGPQQCDGMEDWDGTPWIMFDNGSWMHAHDVTHREPDSLEKLRNDMNYRIIEGNYPGTAHEYLCQCANRLTAIMERDA